MKFTDTLFILFFATTTVVVFIAWAVERIRRMKVDGENQHLKEQLHRQMKDARYMYNSKRK